MGALVVAFGTAEERLRTGFAQVVALAEAYPDLEANVQYRALQERISGLEAAIADRREFYNDSVRINNVTVERFPTSVLAGWFAFRPAGLLKFRDV